MKFRYVAVAALAVAGHQHLFAGYRVIGSAPEQTYTAPVVTPVTGYAVQAQPDQAARIRQLEAENAALKARLRDREQSEWDYTKRRASSHEADSTTSISFTTGGTKASAAKNALILERARSATNIEIVGYTDNTGSAQINKRIALARAQLVKDFLVRNGIPASRVQVREQAGVYYDTNATAAGRAANRRAVVTFH